MMSRRFWLGLLVLLPWMTIRGEESLLERVQSEQHSARAEAMKLLERWWAATGMDRPEAEVYPREMVLELITGADDTKRTRIRAVLEPVKRYSVYQESPDGTKHLELRDSVGTVWILSETLGVGRRNAPSEIVHRLRRRLDREFLKKTYGDWRRHHDVEHNGRKYHTILLTRRGGGPDLWFFDATTGLLARVGPPFDYENSDAVAVRFEDYREIDGVMEPMEMSSSSGASRIVARTLSLRNRAPLAANAFQLPGPAARMWTLSEGVFQRYVEACGGPAALAQIVSRVTRSRNTSKASGVTYEVVLAQKLPDWFVMETIVPGVGTSWQGYNGEGWATSELQGFRRLAGDELKAYIAAYDLHNIDNVTRLYPFRRIVGEKTVGGRRTLALALAGELMMQGTYYFDRGSGHLVRLEANVRTESGEPMPMSFDFSDFRKADGVVIPFRTVVTTPIDEVTSEVVSVEHNGEIPDEQFAPRKLE